MKVEFKLKDLETNETLETKTLKIQQMRTQTNY